MIQKYVRTVHVISTYTIGNALIYGKLILTRQHVMTRESNMQVLIIVYHTCDSPVETVLV